MSPVGLANTWISTGIVQKSPGSLLYISISTLKSQIGCLDTREYYHIYLVKHLH